MDSVEDALFVYQLATGALLADYSLDSLNQSPRGIWSDGLTIWISDDGANRIFAYRIENETLNRYEDEEFTFRSLLKAGNGDARGIWSDGDVIYVADEQDDQVYSYNIPDAIQARLGALSLSALELGGFRAARLAYPVEAPVGTASTTIVASATQAAATVAIAPADADADAHGHQISAGGRDDDHHHGHIRGRQPQPDLHDRGAPTVLSAGPERRASEPGPLHRRQHRRACSLRPQAWPVCVLSLSGRVLGRLFPRRARIPQSPLPQPLRRRPAARHVTDRKADHSSQREH